MSNPQSFVFRIIAKILSSHIDSISSIPKLRRFMGAGSKKLTLHRGMTLEKNSADGVPVEWILPPNPVPQTVVFYLHGGGWTLGLYNSHRSMASYICESASSRALMVDYRLAPENPFPAALEDCVTAYRWLLKSGIPAQKIVIAGDSAGGNLTLTTIMKLREEGDPLPAAAVCISPMTDLLCTGGTFHTNSGPLLSPKFASTMAGAYYGEQDPTLPLISPHYGSLEGFPPLLIHVGEDEILLSDAQRLAEHASHDGIQVRLKVWPKMWHVWHTFVPYLPEAKQAVDEIGAFIDVATRTDKA